MNFERMYYLDEEIGLFCKLDDVFYFFGNAKLQRKDLAVLFPQLQFYEVKQVHGSSVVPASSNVIEADGHWTDETQKALLIQTADCIPILLNQGKRIIALHSGWRGTLANILSEGLRLFDPTKPVSLACGPHIQSSSFEVDRQLALEFSQKFYNPQGFEKVSKRGANTSPEKAFLDLKSVLDWQLKQSKFITKAFYFSEIDTVTDHGYNSYRRFKRQQSALPFHGRNYSFVARLSQ